MTHHEISKRDEALTFLRSHKAGVLATVSAEGRPHASAVYYVADENFNIYFLTLLNTRKITAMQANPYVAFTVGTQHAPQTIQIEGVAVELSHEEDVLAHIPELVKTLTSDSTYYAPITRLDQSDVVVMKIRAEWIRWADYTSPQSGGENIFTQIEVR